MGRTAGLDDFARLVPASVRQKLNLGELKALSGALLVKDRIQQFFINCARHQSALQAWKVREGYCGGAPTCLVYLGPDSKFKMCTSCRKNKVRWTRGETRKNKRSEYGTIRVKEKSAERAERARKG
jgi:hypothetical protein